MTDAKVLPLTEKAGESVASAAKAAGVRVGEYYIRDSAGILPVGEALEFMWLCEPKIQYAKFGQNNQVEETQEYPQEEVPLGYEEHITGDILVFRGNANPTKASIDFRRTQAAGFIDAAKVYALAADDASWAERSDKHKESVENCDEAGGRVLYSVTFKGVKSKAGHTYYRSNNGIPQPATQDEANEWKEAKGVACA